MTTLVNLVKSALTAGLMRAAYDRATSDPTFRDEARRIASWSRAYARAAGLSVPIPRLREECDS